ncbi:hypothetical protein [Sphingomonas xanthus]|uniref:Spore coat protein U domain-containing protein n=1 Tax=Sphingomonas xanthus TaxID=2594473 RepID=A0A516IU99_9SPHN|nr:hypothetical protein [Sphingomonas xanthus]QDP20414.1 hypothetical protein FMM02_10895 [Sphingomonas xanthus]
MSATIKQCALALLLVGSSGVAYASTQGTAGATSSGSVNINASVPARVRISNLSDVNLSNVDPMVDALNAQSVCVWSNTSTRGYNVTASGSGAGNAFTLSSGALPVVPYSVEWAASAGQSTGTGLATGVALTGLVSTATSADCSSGPANSASLVVKIASPELQAMPASTNYTGSLTLLVAPE